ncbi:unnamed protein product [Umbelopsis vinacea]
MNATAIADLSWAERNWVTLYEGRNEIVVTGMVAFVMHEVVYFGRYLPFFICDFIPAFQKYKLQPDKVNVSEDYWKCVRQVLFCHFCFELPMIFFFHPMGHLFGMKITEVPFPTWQTMAIQIAVFFFFEDFWHYWAHRGLHYGPLYKHIHKLHHDYSAPFGMAAEYAHPVETMVLGLGTVAVPLIWLVITGDLHIITMFAWILLRLFQAIDAHSGYDFPWSLRQFLPFWAGSDHHDAHHQLFITNYASSFRWWDFIFGTDTRYRNLRKRQALEKAKAAKIN